MGDERKCCKRCKTRLYYCVMAGMYALLLLITLITLGTFGRQFAETTNFWSTEVNSAVNAVCVLYGSDGLVNPTLGNNASCGFVFWAVVTMVLVFLVWTAIHVLMAVIGRPKAISFFRIADLIVTASMGFLSLIVSSVLTDGLDKTCNGFPDTAEPSCSDRQFRAGTGTATLSFFGNLNAAKNSSWTVTVLLICLSIFYIVLLFMGCCANKYKKGKEDITDAKEDTGDKEKNGDEELDEKS